jgi:hypothetical protein
MLRLIPGLAERLACPAQPAEERSLIVMELATELLIAQQHVQELQALLFERRTAGWYVSNFRAEAVPHLRQINDRLALALAKVAAR